jgi:4-amino-4-deoxy-L-arabinose transferase-like glycosyltransferase
MKPRWSWRTHIHLLMPLVFLILMFIYFPFREHFEFDPDEGVEAMKALLLARGYSMYSEIWSDQPPLLTYFLASWIRIFGADIDALRSLVLLFSGVLMTAGAYFLRNTWGVLHAIACCVLIFLLPFYNILSVSVMLAVPVLTFAFLSLLFLSAWHQQHKDRWLVLSALALALSVLTKLIIVFLVPIFALGILIDAITKMGNDAPWHRLLRPVVLWGLVFVIAGGGLGVLMVGPANIGQLIGIHLAASQSPIYIERANSTSINWLLGDAWPILLLAIPGCFFMLQERRWLSLYLLAWIASAYTLLSVIVPVRYHYQHLVSLPATLLAAIAVGESVRQLPQIFRRRAFLTSRFLLVACALVSTAIAIGVRFPLTQPDFDRPPVFVTHGAHAPWAEQIFLTKMANHAPETHWVITDLPMYAFRVGLLVPPYLAVPSSKRFITGALTEEQLTEFVEEYNPEQVLIGHNVFPELEMLLQNDYRILYTRGKRQLYLRKDLKAGK